MATGLGKTWLAAFDSARPHRRVLFIAHREEILRQSRDVFRQVRPSASLGSSSATRSDPMRGRLRPVQTLAGRLDEFAADAFDYVVVDEFHHAAAPTYRRVIDHFGPRFLLGLTATPERMDGADLLALCGDNLVFECGLVEGIDASELVPFRYWGVPDVVDFEPIPWRNGRFDPDAAQAVETQERAQRALEEWQERRASARSASASTTPRRLHGRVLRRGIRAVAVHSGPSQRPATRSSSGSASGELDVVFAVDVFNEGVDTRRSTRC